MPTISVIIPNYNHAKYLPRRIESVLSQSFPSGEMEVLILDDCSTDNSREIIMKYAAGDTRVKTVFNEKNSGSTFKQWKKGLSLAKGKFIWVAESDDWADNTFLEKLCPLLQNNSDVGIAYCQSWQVDKDDKIVHSFFEGNHIKISHRWAHDYINSGTDELKNYYCLKNTIPNASGVLFRKSVADAFFDEIDSFAEMKLVGDKMFWTNMLLRSDIAYVAEHLNFFRKHTENVRTKSSSAQNLIDNFKWLAFLYSHIQVPLHNRIIIRNRLYGWWYSLPVTLLTYLNESNREIRISASKVYKFPYLIFVYLKIKHAILYRIIKPTKIDG